LFSALCAVLAKGWLAKYTPATSGVRSSDACERHLRFEKASLWRLSTIVAGIPLLIQIALFLFFVGLVILTLNDNFGIGLLVLVLTILAAALYLLCTVLPWFSPASPFQTTISDFIPAVARNSRYKPNPKPNPKPELLKVSEVIPSRERVNSARDDTDLVPAKNDGLLSEVMEFLRQARRKPTQSEVEADILAWILVNSVKDETIEESVKAVAGATPTQRLQDALHRSGASANLVQGFIRCFGVVPGLPPRVDDELKVEVYLYALLRLVQFDESAEGNFRSLRDDLLNLGQCLHRLDIFPPWLSPLACALRIRICLGSAEGKYGVQWKQEERSLVELANKGLMPYTRQALFDAAVQGLLRGNSPDLRRTCGVLVCTQLNIREFGRVSQVAD
jgi:hypothetical protein